MEKWSEIWHADYFSHNIIEQNKAMPRFYGMYLIWCATTIVQGLLLLTLMQRQGAWQYRHCFITIARCGWFYVSDLVNKKHEADV